MPLSDEARRKLNDALVHIRGMTERGSVEVEWYYKALVAGAHECFLAGDYEWASDLLARVPPDYYETTLPIHMELDPAFGEKAFMVAEVLVATGMVSVGFTEEEQSKVEAV